MIKTEPIKGSHLKHQAATDGHLNNLSEAANELPGTTLINQRWLAGGDDCSDMITMEEEEEEEDNGVKNEGKQNQEEAND